MCKVTPLQPQKACPGTCKGGACSAALRVWVAAACSGRIALYTKRESHLTPLMHDEGMVFPSLEAFLRYISDAAEMRAFDQLVVVGTESDIAWVHAALPASLAKYIAAEIKYPLLPGWFTEAAPLPHLTKALTPLFS